MLFHDLTEALARNRASEILTCSEDASDWTAEHLCSDLPGKWELSFIAERDGKVVGYAVLSTKFGPPHLHQFMVRPDLRSNGVGGRMLDEIARRIGPVTLKVDRDNARAIAFYERHGFTVTGDSGQYLWMRKVTAG